MSICNYKKNYRNYSICLLKKDKKKGIQNKYKIHEVSFIAYLVKNQYN